MKKHLNGMLAVALLLLILAGCKKDEKFTCSLLATDDVAPVGMTVVYKATQTGDGAISSLSYASATGMITVSNPTLPWTVTVEVPMNTHVTMTATGTTTNGSLDIEYRGSGEGHTMYASDNCSHATE